jgi:fatty acid synthase subunit beta, fungi type
LDVVRNNPTELTIHFRGRQGRKVLSNYLAMKTEVRNADGSRHFVPLLPGLTPQSTLYTFSEARGLLWATQFAQPAIVLLERATFDHMQAAQLIQEGATFAGHSLGEYGALYSMAEFAEFKNMLSIGFYRGLMMQFALPRDSTGLTGYSMAAINPSRVGKCR